MNDRPDKSSTKYGQSYVPNGTKAMGNISEEQL